MRTTGFALSLILIAASAREAVAEAPTREDATAALQKAVDFFHTQVASHGGYVWKYSDDLEHRQGEGIANRDIIWVQPPGTSAVGLAMMDVYDATGDKTALAAAKNAADALVQGQLYSGGWYYSITFDPAERRKIPYRKPPTKGKPVVRVDPSSPGGWVEWRKRRFKTNMTMMDDDVTQTSLQLLMRVDKALGFKNKDIHEAAEYGLASIMKAQFPVGAWSHNYDRFPRKSPSVEYYPVKKASYPETWSRKWTKKFAGCYELNDEITADGVVTLLEAYRVYGKKEYLDAALRGGQFLLLAQMPEPQPAWAQQYDRNMQPVWERPFEPPAIASHESQAAIRTLLLLYERTGQARFLDAVPKAIAYLEKSKLKDGKLSRFYELKTNRPLYFTKKYQLTYNRGEMPSHYGFIMESHLDELSARYIQLKEQGPKAKTPSPTRAALAGKVQKIIAGMDKRGAWLEPGWVRDSRGRKVRPRAGIIQSATFLANVRVLIDYISAKR